MPQFDFLEVKKLFLSCQNDINDPNTFEYIISNSLFFAFYLDNKLLGCVYFYPIDNRIFLNAFAIRHSHNLILICFKFILSQFSCPLFAITDKKHAIFTLRKSGFSKLSDNLFVFYP